MSENLDEFTRSYLTTMLWATSNPDAEDNPEIKEHLDGTYGIEDIAPEALKQAIEDCKAFQETNAKWITAEHLLRSSSRTSSPAALAGHDFWLTRCGHGAGFWDGDWSDEADKAMTTCSKAFGNVDPYPHEGKIYF
jgi:hypothetical protein